MDATTPTLPAKARIYETLYALNRGFEISLLSLEQLEQLGLFEAEELRAPQNFLGTHVGPGERGNHRGIAAV